MPKETNNIIQEMKLEIKQMREQHNEEMKEIREELQKHQRKIKQLEEEETTMESQQMQADIIALDLEEQITQIKSENDKWIKKVKADAAKWKNTTTKETKELQEGANQWRLDFMKHIQIHIEQIKTQEEQTMNEISTAGNSFYNRLRQEVHNMADKAHTNTVFNWIRPTLKQLMGTELENMIHNMSSNTASGMVDHQLRILEKEVVRKRREATAQAETTILQKRQEAMGVITAQATALTKTLQEKAKTLISNIENTYDDINEVATQNLDSAPAFYKEVMEEVVEQHKTSIENAMEKKAESLQKRMEIIFKNKEHMMSTRMDDILKIKTPDIQNLLRSRLSDTIDKMKESIENLATAERTKLRATAQTGMADVRNVAEDIQKELEEASEIISGQIKTFNAMTEEHDRQQGIHINTASQAYPTQGDPPDPEDPDDSGDEGDEHNGRGNRPPPYINSNRNSMRRVREQVVLEKISGFVDKYHKHITTTDIKSESEAELFYDSIQILMHRYFLPLLTLQELTAEYTTSISREQKEELQDISTTLLPFLSKTLYMKLAGTFDTAGPKVQQIIQVHSTTKDGYKTIYDLMQTFLTALDPYSEHRWGPTWQQTTTPHAYATKLLRTARKDKGRPYSEKDLMVEYILQSSMLPQFKHLAAGFLLHIDIHGTKHLQQYSFHRLIKLYSYVNGDEEKLLESEDPTHISISKVNGNNQRRGWAKHSVQCSICHQYGHSPTKGHICYFTGQLWHALDHMKHLDKTKIPETEVKNLQENAAKFDTYNMPRYITKASARLGVDLTELESEAMSHMVATEDYERPDFH